MSQVAPETARFVVEAFVIVNRPLLLMYAAVEEAEVTASKMLPVEPPHTVSLLYGELVPMPTLPALLLKMLVPEVVQ